MFSASFSSLLCTPLTDKNHRVARQDRLDRSLGHDYDAKLRKGGEDLLFLLHKYLDSLHQTEGGATTTAAQAVAGFDGASSNVRMGGYVEVEICDKKPPCVWRRLVATSPVALGG